MGFGFASEFFFLGGLVFLRFCAGDGKLAAHEELVMEDFDGTFCFIDIEHFHEPVTFGAVGFAVIDDLYTADGSNSLEEFLEIALGGLVREVSDIDTAVLDGGRVSATTSAFTFTTFAAIATALWLFVGVLAAVAVGLCAGIAGLGAARLAFFHGLDRIRAALRAGRTDGLLVETNGFQQFLPPAKLDGRRHRAALGLS